MKSDYEFWRDIATIFSYLLLALSILSARLIPDAILLLIVMFFCFAIGLCGFKMFQERKKHKD
jgi:hypothetical protein